MTLVYLKNTCIVTEHVDQLTQDCSNLKLIYTHVLFIILLKLVYYLMTNL